MLTNCTPSGGDTAWMLTSVALVLMMTIPGLGLFYGGMVRKKNVGDTVMTSFAITALVTVIYAIVTYSPVVHRRHAVHRRIELALFLQGILSDVNNGGIGNPNPLAPTIPETVYMCFQMTFAIITPALIAGAFAERMKFSAMLWFMGLWAIFVYAPVAHWLWGPDGIFNSTQPRRLGQGSRLRRRHGRAHQRGRRGSGRRASCWASARTPGPGHNMVLTFIGAGLLWVGWFGFNAGSAVSAGVQAGMAMTVTQIATAVAALTWMFVEWAHRGKPTVIGICSGAVAGLVAITPASGFVGPIGAMVIGVACGVGCYWARPASSTCFGYDDALDCFGVHGVGGMIGALLTGVFAVQQYGGTAGLLEGNPGQVVNQCIGIVTVIVYDAIVTVIILSIIKAVIGLRVSEESSATASTSPCTAKSFTELRRPAASRAAGRSSSPRTLDAPRGVHFFSSDERARDGAAAALSLVKVRPALTGRT